MPKSYFVYHPQEVGSVEDEWRQCLEQINETRSSGYAPVKVNIFIDQPDFNAFLITRASISKNVSDTFGRDCPAFNITVHPPEKPFKVAVEATFINSDSGKFDSKVFNSIPYVVLESEMGKEIWAGGVSSFLFPNDTRKASEDAFDLMVGILEHEQMSLNHLVRQWNYIGNILTEKESFQNYQVFNEVRSEYFQKYRTISGYPAATGVGMMHGGVILDFCAIKPEESVFIKAIDNPDQINAYNYGQEVLKGYSANNKLKNPPQFERALMLSNSNSLILYVSGTASIIGQDTIGIEDIEKQTIVTIENINKLADADHISHLLSGMIVSCEKFSLMRVYIKRQNDFSIARRIFYNHFPQTPVLFIEADICRDNLLIEIEAELYL